MRGLSTSEAIKSDAHEHELKQDMKELSNSCSRLHDEIGRMHHEEEQLRHREAAEADRLTRQANSREESCSEIAAELRALAGASEVLEDLWNQRERSTEGLHDSVDRFRDLSFKLQQHGLPDKVVVFDSLAASLEASLGQGKLLAAEEQDLKNQRSASEERLELLRSEAVEREQQFSTITQDLQAQVTHLLVKIRFAEEAPQRKSQIHVSAPPPPGRRQAEDMDLSTHGIAYGNQDTHSNMFFAGRTAHEASNNLFFEPVAIASTTHSGSRGSESLWPPDEHSATPTPGAASCPTNRIVSFGLPAFPVASSSWPMHGDVALAEPTTSACFQQLPQLLTSQQPLGLSQQQLRARQQLQGTPWLSPAPPSLNSVGPAASTPPPRARASGPGPQWRPQQEFDAGGLFEERILELRGVIGESLRTLDEEQGVG